MLLQSSFLPIHVSLLPIFLKISILALFSPFSSTKGVSVRIRIANFTPQLPASL